MLLTGTANFFTQLCPFSPNAEVIDSDAQFLVFPTDVKVFYRALPLSPISGIVDGFGVNVKLSA